MTQEGVEEIIVDKAHQVAFLSLRKLHVTPFVRPDGRVSFIVKGNVSGVLGEMQDNPCVPILDYLQRLEAIKSIIFTLKRHKKNGEPTG